MRTVQRLSLGIGIALATASMALALDCSGVDNLLQQGFSVVEIARATGVPSSTIAACQRSRQGVAVRHGHFGAAGPPPVGAAGPPPVGAAGPPPVGAAGPPPFNAAGPGPGTP